MKTKDDSIKTIHKQLSCGARGHVMAFRHWRRHVCIYYTFGCVKCGVTYEVHERMLSEWEQAEVDRIFARCGIRATD